MSSRTRLAGALIAASLVLAALGAQGASAAESGAFFTTGSMTVPRFAPVAAPLGDGRVLVAGGATGKPIVVPVSSAEIFNPAKGRFSPTGSMSVERSGAVAAPIPGGRVLVAGGQSKNEDLSSAEIFDPATGTFSPTGSMSTARVLAAAAPLPDGRVLVVGGYGDTGSSSSAEIFDPATNSFSPAAVVVPSDQAQGGGAAPLPDGRVLFAGGIVDEGRVVFASSGAEIFDPGTGTFSATGGMSFGRYEAAAASLPDGVLVVGSGLGPLYSSAEVFTSTTNSFRSAGIGAMQFARSAPAAAPLRGGRALVVGGALDGPLSSAEIFAPISCRGKAGTIVATAGADRGLRGTPQRNVIFGLAGNDELWGLGGNDLICAGEGKDAVLGQNGNDRLLGQEGNDTLAGGGDDDVIKGGRGKDILIGGPGDDILKGGGGKDILKGGPGKDTKVQ
jgi:Ca2+-binding RTX toxin-like protein